VRNRPAGKRHMRISSRRAAVRGIAAIGGPARYVVIMR
jgi:hypothetical protein